MIACIFVSLECLHSKNIIHRDIKPENLVLDNFGYVRVTDLGIARIMRNENSADTSGTPGYMAPEVMCRLNHNYAVDYFALGVIAYEFMLGRVPNILMDIETIFGAYEKRNTRSNTSQVDTNKEN